MHEKYMHFPDRKMDIEVVFGDRKAIVKILSVNSYPKVRIERNFNEIITKYRISYDHLVSDHFLSSEYAIAVKFVENEMLERGLDIAIYSIGDIEKKSLLKILFKYILVFFRILFVAIFFFGIFTIING